MNSRLIPLLALVLFASQSARAEDWPEFRGPTGQGIVRQGGMPLEWGPDKQVIWKQTITGLGWSSPVVVAGRIYLTTAIPASDNPTTDQSLQALCLEAASGKLLWQKEVFKQSATTAPKVHSKNSHASPTPLVALGKLYVHFGHQGTACLTTDGAIVWTNRELTYKPVHGNGGSPILVDDLLIVSCDGSDQRFVVALDTNTGKVRWKTPRSNEPNLGFSFSTPLLITVNDKRQIISPASDMVAAYDPATGKEIWKVRYTGYSVVPRPVYGHGLVFICTGYNTPSLLAIRPTGQGDITDTHVAWKTTKSVPHSASVILVGDELYMVSDRGSASCLDAKTGEVHWSERLGGNYSASPVFAEGKIYFQSEEGIGSVVPATMKYEVVARNNIRERTLASYAVVDGALFLRTEKHLFRIGK